MVSLFNSAFDECHLLSDKLCRLRLEEAARTLSAKFDVPRHFFFLLLAVEDKRFWSHQGIDILALSRATVSNLARRNVVQGASTITQQLYGMLNSDLGFQKRDLSYKIQKIKWAMKKEKCSNKFDIMKDYLCHVYWGRSYYGLAAASSGYFGVAQTHLSVAQSFFLVDRLATPNMMLQRRTFELLTRPLLWSLFIEYPKQLDELVELYQGHFEEGIESWRLRERLIKK